MITEILMSPITLRCAIGVIVGATILITRGLVRENRWLREGLEEAKQANRALKAKAIEERRAALVRNEALEKHCIQLDRKVLAVEARQQRLEGQAGGNRPYELAMQMAGRGAGIEELVAAGLSRGEAELALRMHGLAVS